MRNIQDAELPNDQVQRPRDNDSQPETETQSRGSLERLVRLRKSNSDNEIKSIHRRIQLKRNVEKLVNTIFHISTFGLFRHIYNLELPCLRIENDYNLIQTQTSVMSRQLPADN